MTINPPLQARAGRNSPDRTFFPIWNAFRNVIKKLTAAVAPGVDLKIAEGGEGILYFQGIRAFIGSNTGLAQLTLTGSLRRDSDGAVFDTDVQTLGPGANAEASFNLGNGVLPEGFSLWVNVVLAAGAYGGDAVIETSLAKTVGFVNEGPKDLSTALEVVIEVEEGHSKMLGPLELFNRDTVDHDVEVYLSNSIDDMLVGVTSIPAGASAPVNPFAGLNSDETMKMRLLVAIVTPGRSVTVFGTSVESNQLV